MSSIEHCKKCGTPLSQNAVWGKVCTRCDKRPRCKECGVLVRGKQRKQEQCDFCVSYKTTVKYTCSGCGRTIAHQGQGHYNQFGNFCKLCAMECHNRGMKNKGEAAKWLKEWLSSICG